MPGLVQQVYEYLYLSVSQSAKASISGTVSFITFVHVPLNGSVMIARREQGLLLYERRRRASMRSSLTKSYERYDRISSASSLAAAASVDPLAASRVQLLPSN